MASMPIRACRTTTDNQPAVRRLKEGASKTFLDGTPVQIHTDGFLQAWDGSDLTDSIVGFSQEAGSGLAVAGVPHTLHYGTVPHMPSAVKIPRGAPINDGRCGVELAVVETVFKGQINPTGQSLTQADIGINYGLTIDSDGYWYVDKSKTGANAAVQIVDLDESEKNLAAASRRGVYFIVMPAVIHWFA